MRMYPSLRMVFARNVKQNRTAAQLSQEDLAELAQLHRTYISDIERGMRNVSIDNIERIANALGVSPASLLSPKGSK